MKVYVAGKVTGLREEDVLEKFEASRKYLQGEGHKVMLPSVLLANAGFEHEEYMHICYAMIDVCDAVYMLSDWRQSKGACLEFSYARERSKKIIFEGQVSPYYF